jgi:pentatricopeptide repeat protein
MISQSEEGRTSIRPNTITINCVLDALAKAGAASRAEKLLSRMERHSENHLDRVSLNTISYTSGKWYDCKGLDCNGLFSDVR